MPLDTQDKRYIKDTVRKEVKKEITSAISASEKRTNHRTDILIEKVREDIRILNETIEARTRIIVREELAEAIRPIQISTELFRQEMIQLRREHDAHVSNYAIHH